MTVPAIYTAPVVAAKIALVAESFARLLGRPLVPGDDDPVSALWVAPQAIVAHGSEPDPIFFFGNRAALDLFETRPEQFAAMPSRLSAEAPLQAERAAFLERVARDGFVDGYAGVRISARGRRFIIRDGIVWNLVDGQGRIYGQAATFPLS